MKRVKNFIKKVGHFYADAFNEMYGPILKCGINPIM